MPARFSPKAQPDIQRGSTPVRALPVMTPPPPKARPVMQRPAAPPQRVAASPAPPRPSAPPWGGGGQPPDMRPPMGGTGQPPDIRPPIPQPPRPPAPIGGIPYRTPPPFDTSFFQNQMDANPNLPPGIMQALQQLQGVYGPGSFYDVNGSQQGWVGSGPSMLGPQFRPSAYMMGGAGAQQPQTTMGGSQYGRAPGVFQPTYQPPTQMPSITAGGGRTPAFTPSIGSTVQQNPYR